MKLGILLVAYGANNQSAHQALTLFDKKVREQFVGVPVRWAFTSLLLRNRLAAARIKRDSVAKALQKMRFEKYTHVAVQPLQTIAGQEYENVYTESLQVDAAHADFFVQVGAPLLFNQDDIQKAAAAIVFHAPKERKADEAVVLMGHGAKHVNVQCYDALAKAVYDLDAHIHVGTMTGSMQIEDILPKLLPEKKVWLMPLLSVVGVHTLEDMAGTQSDSWRSRIEEAGFLCEPVLRGIVEYDKFIDIWLSHLQITLDNMSV